MVFELNPKSSYGHTVLSGCSYQTCWNIVGQDLINVVHAFFQRATLPKSITHTNFVLIPKKDVI